MGNAAVAAGDVMHEVEVPPDLVGALIGKQGSCIHDLEKRAGGGVHIQIPPAAVSGVNQVAQITGPPLEASMGKLLVQQKLDELRNERFAHEQLQWQQQSLQTSQPVPVEGQLGPISGLETLAPQGSPTGARLTPLLQNEAAHQVEVPVDLIGALIGKQGACVNELQNRAGAGVHIEILPPQTIGSPQIAQITGPALQAAVGVALVQQKIEELRRERTAHEFLRGGTGQAPLQAMTYTQPAAALSSIEYVAPQAPAAGVVQAGQSALSPQALIQAAAALLGAALQKR